MKAIIFSSEIDLPYARLCREYLSNEFQIQTVIESGLPKDRSTYGLLGADTAREMCKSMINAVTDVGEIVARVDADSKLLPLGISWLSSATYHAHGYSVGFRRNICSSFSATKGHLIKAMELLKTARGNGCSGCLICHALLRTGPGMVRTNGLWPTDSNGELEDIPVDAHFITLPQRSLDSHRVKQMNALWSVKA